MIFTGAQTVVSEGVCFIDPVKVEIETQAIVPPPPAPICEGSPATFVGTSGDDTLTGTGGADVVAGLEGNDTIDAPM